MVFEMHLIGANIGGYRSFWGGRPPFPDIVELKFDKQANLFIGPNASGKTSALRDIAGMLTGREPGRFGFGYSVYPGKIPQRAGLPPSGRDPGIGPTLRRGVSVSDDWAYDLESGIPVAPVIYVPAERVSRRPVRQGHPTMHSPAEFASELSSRRIKSWIEEDKLTVPSWISELSLIALWSNLETDYSDGSIFWAEVVQQAIDTMSNISITDPRIDSTIKEIIDISHHCASDIADGLLEDKWEDLGTRVYPTGYVMVGDPIVYGDGLDLSEMSSGTENTIWWVRYIALKLWWIWYKLTLLNPDTAEYPYDWHRKPAVLFIDEIENHLHPTWQRRVIPALLEYFPGLQIFATTHSPFVVAGLKAGQVHLFNRDENGVVTPTTNTEDIVGWTADEILRTYMGVHDPTDVETASAAAELRKLRDEGPWEDDHAEQDRQDRMRELRVAVDTNVLSGPRVAEDERFAATLESILERYRQSTDLNQENG